LAAKAHYAIAAETIDAAIGAVGLNSSPACAFLARAAVGLNSSPAQ
jgi:hypothetical protein